MAANSSKAELTNPTATVLDVAEEMREGFIEETQETFESSPWNLLQRRKRNEALYCKLLQGKLRDLSEKEKR
jgi:hypothetical protein